MILLAFLYLKFVICMKMFFENLDGGLTFERFMELAQNEAERRMKQQEESL